MRALVRAELEGCCDAVRCPVSGNVICRKGSGGPGVALLAHMDEVGFMVQGITADGFLLMVPLGGWWNHTLPSQRVVVHTRAGRRIPGQVGTKPPHLLPESQRKQVLPNEALFVDVGASCEEEVLALGIRVGCAVTPDVQMQPLAVPHRWMGKAFDNRAGLYCMIEAMKQLIETKFQAAYQAGALRLFAASSADEEETEGWIAEIKRIFPGMEVMCDNLSLGVSCHTGPGALGIGCSVCPEFEDAEE